MDEFVHALVKEGGPWRLIVAGLVALVAVLAGILSLAAIVVPYLAAAGAFGIVLGGLAKLVRAWRNR
ncbi:hypothetical protein AB0F52_48445 [Amycolatopsis sp. NPDC024027]|uniref:hypothetical protein n=1 Tax=Amycolatopsis sp. NPDC024027 TaxID=3154327 RepID=UPI0033EC703B